MILHRILEHKKAELRRKQSRGYLSSMRTRIADQGTPLGFIKALEAGQSATAPALIAEVKKASPSKGLMRPEFKDQFKPVEIAKHYQDAGGITEGWDFLPILFKTVGGSSQPMRAFRQ